MMKKFAKTFDFTCMEMTDSSDCGSRPVELVIQSINAAHQASLGYDGENALGLQKLFSLPFRNSISRD